MFSLFQNIVGNAKPKERGNEIPSSPEKQEKFKDQRKATGNAKKDKDEKTLKTEKRVKQPDKEGKLIGISEKGKVSEKNISKNGKEDKENISENDMEYSIDTQIEKKPENDNVKSPQENVKETKRKRGRPPVTPPTGMYLNINVQAMYQNPCKLTQRNKKYLALSQPHSLETYRNV